MAKGYPMRISEQEAADRIREKTCGRFVYLSGYICKESKITVRCSVCGETYDRTYHHVTTHGIECKSCRNRAKEEAKELERLRKSTRQRAKALLKELKRIRKETPHNCPVCGTPTTRQKYCCDKCRDKANNKAKEVRRRKRISAVIQDRDITVAGVFNRDRGVCYLCGGKCNPKDYVIRGGVFIAGDMYPSIDHVVPLVAGGRHSWNNVRLAHRLCNSIKSGGEYHGKDRRGPL